MTSSDHTKTHILEPGTYQITNPLTGTAIDLAGYDGRSLIGYATHKGLNQQWELKRLGLGYSLCSLYNGFYLTVEEGLREGVDVVATGYPVSWAIQQDAGTNEALYRILWPNSHFNFELLRKEGDGSGGKIRLSRREESKQTQLWRIVPCHNNVAPIASNTQHQVNSSTNPDGPAQAAATTTAETVIDTESFRNVNEGAGEMVITTTTTTVTTTVTKVQRVKAADIADVLSNAEPGYHDDAVTEGEGEFEVVKRYV